MRTPDSVCEFESKQRTAAVLPVDPGVTVQVMVTVFELATGGLKSILYVRLCAKTLLNAEAGRACLDNTRASHAADHDVRRGIRRRLGERAYQENVLSHANYTASA